MSDPSTRSAARRGRTLKLYLVDGSPSGVITAELGVSSVRAAVASRTALPELVKREEASRTGVYLLLGPDPDLSGRQLVYVGEGDQVKTRLVAHDSDESKEFFTRAVLVVSKDENLTKAHGRYLESRIIAAIREAGRAKLVNGTEPAFKGLPEAEIADMERVVDEIEILLPVLGFDLLRTVGQEAGAPLVNPADKTTPMAGSAEFASRDGAPEARALEAGDEFVVLAGSFARAKENPSISETYVRRRKELQDAGALVPTEDGMNLRFSKDVAFDSPSGAGSVVAGGNVNGREFWRHAKTGERYGDWRASRIGGGSA
jgi:hypothetical protein